MMLIPIKISIKTVLFLFLVISFSFFVTACGGGSSTAVDKVVDDISPPVIGGIGLGD